MKKDISFLYSLSSDLNDRLRVTATKKKGEISSFVVQYEAMIKDEWYGIVRYDTRHGFAHKDIIHANGRKDKQPLYFPNYSLAFTFAINDIKTLWKWYRYGYEKEMGVHE